MTSWLPRFLEPAYSETPMGKVSCFLPEAHTLAIFCYITAGLVAKSKNFSVNDIFEKKADTRTVFFFNQDTCL